MTKPWPRSLPKNDISPDDFADLSVETQRLVVHGDHVYFFVWCQDMDDFDLQQSILFRVHRSFDRPAERLASIETQIVDLAVHDGMLVALENGTDDEGGFGVVHRIAPGASKPESSTRLEVGKLFKAIAPGPDGSLVVVGNCVQRFDGAAWHGKALTFGDADLHAVDSNGKLTVGVGTEGLVLVLEPDGNWRPIGKTDRLGPQYSGVDVADDGTVSIAGIYGKCLQGSIDALAPLEDANEHAVFDDTCVFQGKRYWSAAGDAGVGGLYVQNGKKLELVFENQSCFKLTPTDEYLFIASEAGILRYDGKDEWKPVSTDFDEDDSVWVMTPGEPKEEEDDEDDDE